MSAPVVTLVDRNKGVVDAWLAAGLNAKHGSIFDYPADGIVSPANSFGFMDGGIDLAYSQRFGWGVQEAVQRRIRADHDGELLVGQALIAPTGDSFFPVLIVAPTMRVPMTIPDPAQVYLATRAAIRLAVKSNMDSVVLPGMGAGCGRVKPEWVAAMMKAGIDDALNPPEFPATLAQAADRHYAPHRAAPALAA